MFAIQSDREWRRFCETILPSIIGDDRFTTNADRLRRRDELEALIEEKFRRLTVREVAGLLEKAGLATGIVNDVPAVAAHPQLAARHRWVEVDSPCGPIPAPIPPHNLRTVTPRMGRVPALGEHTDEILKEIGK
jgi:itaconate CoA-transferase